MPATTSAFAYSVPQQQEPERLRRNCDLLELRPECFVARNGVELPHGAAPRQSQRFGIDSERNVSECVHLLGKLDVGPVKRMSPVRSGTEFPGQLNPVVVTSNRERRALGTVVPA